MNNNHKQIKKITNKKYNKQKITNKKYKQYNLIIYQNNSNESFSILNPIFDF